MGKPNKKNTNFSGAIQSVVKETLSAPPDPVPTPPNPTPFDPEVDQCGHCSHFRPTSFMTGNCFHPKLARVTKYHDTPMAVMTFQDPPRECPLGYPKEWD